MGTGTRQGTPPRPGTAPGAPLAAFALSCALSFVFAPGRPDPAARQARGPSQPFPAPCVPPAPLPGPLPCPPPLGVRTPCRGSASPGSPRAAPRLCRRGLRASLPALCVFVKAQSSPGFGSCCDSRGAPKAQPEPRCPASWCSHGATGGLRAAAAAVAGGPGFQALCKRVNGR